MEEIIQALESDSYFLTLAPFRPAGRISANYIHMMSLCPLDCKIGVIIPNLRTLYL